MIYPIFDSIPDHRVTGRCIYKLGDLLVIALLTMMCDREDYVDMSEFAASRARNFGLLSDCGDNSPSPDTFERLMSAVDPDELERCLIEHGRHFAIVRLGRNTILPLQMFFGVLHSYGSPFIRHFHSPSTFTMPPGIISLSSLPHELKTIPKQITTPAKTYLTDFSITPNYLDEYHKNFSVR